MDGSGSGGAKAGNIAAMAGTGAAAGALIGTAIPGIGNLVGAGVGALVGLAAGGIGAAIASAQTGAATDKEK
jgi:hypothetical protein